MAELREPARPGGPDELTQAGAPTEAATVRALRARVAELEALLEARTHAIVGMGARLAQVQGDPYDPLAARVRELELELELLRATKVLRYSALPRRLYGRVRRG